MKPWILGSPVLVLLLGGVGQARADFIISESGRGWESQFIGNNGNTAGTNYVAGFSSGGIFRNHFDFPIPSLGGVLTGATLSLGNFSSAVSAHQGGTNTFAVSSLGAFGTYPSYTQIGTGTPYGSVDISASVTATITLNAAALVDIAAQQGGTFSLGGVDSGESGSGRDFGASQGLATTLTLSVAAAAAAPVPEPASLALWGMATATFAGYFGWRRRKQAVA
jgi:PEP-CTERM motif-containing protein